MKEPYQEWAQANIDKIKGVLDKSRAEHTQAVKDRISSVEQMKDVVTLTEGLFAVSKVREFLAFLIRLANIHYSLQETAQLEAESFVQGQKVALASEAKAVLDSWVRFEQQQKEAEQAELAKTVIAKVLATVQDEKNQREILNAALAEMERKYFMFLACPDADFPCRARQEQSYIECLFPVRLAVGDGSKYKHLLFA